MLTDELFREIWKVNEIPKTNSQKNTEPEKKQELKIVSANFLASLISNGYVSFFINFISVVSGILTVYGFIETRDKPEDEEDDDPSELFEELGTYIEDLGKEVRLVKDAILELTCRHELAHSKRAMISKDCFKYLQNLENTKTTTTTRRPVFTSERPESNRPIQQLPSELPEEKQSLAAARWFGFT